MLPDTLEFEMMFVSIHLDISKDTIDIWSEKRVIEKNKTEQMRRTQVDGLFFHWIWTNAEHGQHKKANWLCHELMLLEWIVISFKVSPMK